MGAVVLAAGAAAGLLAACGGSTSDGANNTAPAIKFVGNSTCPTASASPYDPSPPGHNGDKAVGQAIDEMPHLHVDPPTKIQYDHDPPTSGCHYNLAAPNPAPIQPGVYGQEIAAEYWVHNLEHGYVAVLYNCPQGCPDDVQKLIAWRKGLGPDPAGNGQIPYAKVIVLPWHTMSVKFAAVSWDWYQGFDSLDISKIQAFYDNHVGHSPEGAMTG
jgi:hypothetical protein